MNATHTPGPWTAQFHNPQKYAGRTHVMITGGNSLVPIAAVVLSAEGVSEDEGRATARLMAASRELLAALKKCIADREDMEDRAFADPDCIECNMGAGPNRRTCGYHEALAVVAKAERAP